MNTEQALATVKNFCRYREGSRRGTVWDQDNGAYVPQLIIPRATKRQNKRMYVVMGTKGKLGAVRGIDPSQLRSTQRCLRFRNLVWNVKNADSMQKTFGRVSTDMDIRGVNLPIVVWVDGTPVIWNGNHRVTALILLGRRRIMVRMYKLRR